MISACPLVLLLVLVVAERANAAKCNPPDCGTGMKCYAEGSEWETCVKEGLLGATAAGGSKNCSKDSDCEDGDQCYAANSKWNRCIKKGTYGATVGMRAEAKFDMNGVNGTIAFHQADAFSPTTVTVDLDGLNKEAGKYHVHFKPIDGNQAEKCSAASVGGHFNPLGVDYKTTKCDSDKPETCEVGDLSALHGALTGKASESKNYTDARLELSGALSIVGRSIVIHKESGGARWVCANIEAKGGGAAAAGSAGLQATDALLIIDVQNCFMEERNKPSNPAYTIKGDGYNETADGDKIAAGPLAVTGSSEIIPHVNAWTKAFTDMGAAVFASLDWHPKGHCSFCRNGTNSNSPGYLKTGKICYQTCPTTVPGAVCGVDMSYRCKDYTSEYDFNRSKYTQWPDHCKQGSFGARFAPGLVLPQTTIVVKKGFEKDYDSYSAFGGRQTTQTGKDSNGTDAFDRIPASGSEDLANRTSLKALLEDKAIKRLWVLGLATDFCVKNSIFDSLGINPASQATKVSTLERTMFVKAASRSVVPGATIDKDSKQITEVEQSSVGKALAELSCESGDCAAWAKADLVGTRWNPITVAPTAMPTNATAAPTAAPTAMPTNATAAPSNAAGSDDSGVTSTTVILSAVGVLFVVLLLTWLVVRKRDAAFSRPGAQAISL